MRRVAIMFIILLAFQALSPVYAERKPMKFAKFGKVDKKTLEMTSYAPDPDAEAILLFDKLAMEIMDDGVLISKRHYRIKILTEEGKEMVDQRIPFYHKGMKVHRLKAHSIMPNGTKIKLKKKDVFEEEKGKWKYKVFAVPGVQVGSVIEVSYEVESQYFTELDPWYFQRGVYTQASQLSVIIPPGYNFRVFFYNLSDIDPIIERQVVPGRKMSKYTWEAMDLPAVKTEPYMRTLEDYWGQMRFQFVSYRDAYNNIEFIKSWESLAEVVRNWYKDYMEDDKGIQGLAESKTTGLTSPEDKAKALYDFVTREIETDGRGGRFVDEDRKPSKILSEKKGSGLEKNLLLVKLLRSVGIEAHPMLIATRNLRRASANVPDLDQFNYAIVYAKISNRPTYLDTRDRFCPFKMLPKNSIVGEGFVIDNAAGQFVAIPEPRSLNMERCETTAALDEFGDLTATTVIRFENYSAIKARKQLDKVGETEFAQTVIGSPLGEVTIDSVSVDNYDMFDAPLNLTVTYSVEGYAQSAGDQLYMKAPALAAYSENPLKSEKRYFPVEYTYYEASTEIMSIELPEGFTVSELPQPSRVGKKKLRYANTWSMDEGKLKVERTFMRRSVVFPSSQYANLRGFFDYTVKFDQQQVVLARSGK